MKWRRRRPSPRWARLVVLAVAAGAVAGCTDRPGSFTGAVTGTVTAALTANPALGAAVGIGTRALTDTAARYGARRWRQREQDALAAQVGGMGVGEARSWQAGAGLPLVGIGPGEIRVLRELETPLAACKEVLFSADPAEPAPRWFLTTVCRQASGWKWAAAEPATGRWDSLR